MKARINMFPESYSTEPGQPPFKVTKWGLAVEFSDGVAKMFMLGQDEKVCQRMLGRTGEDVANEMGEALNMSGRLRAAIALMNKGDDTALRKINDEASAYLADLVLQALDEQVGGDGTEEDREERLRNCEPWTLSVE